MGSLTLFVVILTVLNAGSITALKVSCKTEGNHDVDWYYLYKLPRHHSNSIDSDIEGLRYTYITSDTINTHGWELSNVLINDTSSFPGRTLDSLFDDKDVLVIAYNDQPPDGASDFEYGHTKGLVATDGVHGIWLIHSVPRFPKISKYFYPDNGKIFGQSFLCITFDATTEMNTVATQLLFNEPDVYYSRIPVALSSKYPDLRRVISKDWIGVPPFNNVADLRSLNGTTFRSFAKGARFNAELYEDWIAPMLSTDLLVETWRNSAGRLPSDCTRRNKVFNVGIIEDKRLNFSFKYTSDHSKWAVSQKGQADWICVGDINRDRHQLVRGGGTMCQKHQKVADAYRDVIGSFENC